MKGKNGIHLDNKEHAILEHCLSPDRTKLAATELNLMLLLDVDHVKNAQVHRKSAHTHQNTSHAGLESVVRFFFTAVLVFSHFSVQHRSVSDRTLLVSYTEESPNSCATQSRISTRPRPRPRPHPIYGKKQKMSKSSSSDVSVTRYASFRF